MSDHTQTLQMLRENIAKVIVGREQTVDLLLVCLAAGGHALIEDVPGTGKTILASVGISGILPDSVYAGPSSE